MHHSKCSEICATEGSILALLQAGRHALTDSDRHSVPKILDKLVQKKTSNQSKCYVMFVNLNELCSLKYSIYFVYCWMVYIDFPLLFS